MASATRWMAAEISAASSSEKRFSTWETCPPFISGWPMPTPYPREVLGVKLPDDGADSIVAGGAAAGPYPDSAHRQVHFVVDNHDVRRFHAKPGHQVIYGLAAAVHKGARLGQHYLPFLETAPPQDCLGTAFLDVNTPTAGQQVYAVETHVVPRVPVAVTRIAQPHDDLH